MKRWQADLLLLFVAATWGLSFVFQKTAMDAVGPLAFIAARSAAGSLALIPFVVAENRKARGATLDGFWSFTALSALVLFLGEALQQIGLVTATVTNSGFLTTLYIICVPFIAWGLIGGRPPAFVWAAALLSLAGTMLLSGAAFGAMTEGDKLLAISAPVWALHVVLTSMAARFARPILFTFAQFLIATGLATVAALSFETTTFEDLRKAAPEIAYVGILSSAITFTLFSIALRYAPPAEATILVSTENLFAALGGAVILGERLAWINWLGAFLIVAATLIVRLSAKESDEVAAR